MTVRRRSFLQSAFAVFLPFVGGGAQAEPPTEPIVLPVPEGIGLHATNPQIIRDRAGVIWAATRANTSIGGVVWRVDGYVDANNPGTITFVINDPANPEPEKYHGNGELIVYPDGYLYYVTIEVNDLEHRNGIAQSAYPVPGWTPLL